MTRATVTDKGLARRLGEKVVLTSGDEPEKRWTLVYFPKGFAVLLRGKELAKIEIGEVIGMRRGSGMANYGPHNLDYEYSGH